MNLFSSLDKNYKQYLKEKARLSFQHADVYLETTIF